MTLRISPRGGTWYIRGTVWGTPVYESTHTSDKALAEEIRAKRERQILEGKVQSLDTMAHLPGEEVGYLTSLLIAQLRRISDQPERLKTIDRVIGRILDEACSRSLPVQ